MKKFMTISFLITFSLNSMADCLPYYAERLAQQKLVNIVQAGTVNTSIGAAGAQGAMLVAGMATPAGLISTGATVAALGGVYAFTKVKQAKFVKVIRLLNDAKKGRGKTLSKFHRSLSSKMAKEGYNPISRAELSDILVNMDKNEEVCSYNERKDRYDLFSSKQIQKEILADLGI